MPLNLANLGLEELHVVAGSLPVIDRLSPAGQLMGQGDSGSSLFQLVILVLAAGGLGLVLLSTRKKMVDRSIAARQHRRPRELAKSLEREAAVRNDLDQVMIELDTLSRQIHASIDTRYAKLEAVIRDADDRIAKLGALLDEASSQSPHADSVSLSGESVVAAGAARADSQRAHASRAASGRRLDIQLDEIGPEDAAASLQPEADEAAQLRTAGSLAATDRRSVREQVILLSDKGLSFQQIAEQLSMPVGEVELILALRRAHRSR